MGRGRTAALRIGADVMRHLTPVAGLESQFDLLFLDSEFTRLPAPKEPIWIWAERCKVLSLAIVPIEAISESDGCLYVTRIIGTRILSHCAPFVVEQVIPKFGEAKATAKFNDENGLSQMIEDYLEKRQQKTGRVPLLAVDWLGDAHLLEGLISKANWLLVERIREIEDAMNSGWLPTRTWHNALHDALTIRDGYKSWATSRP